MKKCIRQELVNIKYGSFSGDIWTSDTTLSYLGSVFHYVDEGFFFQSRVLTLSFLDEDHNSRYIHQQMNAVFHEWNLSNKVYF